MVVDAGHGGSDSGAVSSSGVREKDLTLQIAQYMYEEFQKRGVPVTLIRNTDETISPTERVQRILAAYGDNPNVVIYLIILMQLVQIFKVLRGLKLFML